MYKSDIDLVAWMKNTPELLGWDLIAGVPLDVLIRTLWEDFFTKVAQQWLCLKEQSKYDEAGYSWYWMDGQRLHLSSLQVEKDTTLKKPYVIVKGGVEEGVLLQTDELFEVLIVSVNDPINRLDCNVTLPMSMDGKKFALNLQEGRSYNMPLGASKALQDLGAEWFKQLIEALPADQCRTNFFNFTDAKHEGFGAISDVHVFTQAQESEDRQAILFFVNFEGGGTGVVPEAADFPLVLSAGADRGNSTLMLSPRYLHRYSYGPALLAAIKDGQFVSETTEKGTLRLKAEQGVLPISKNIISTGGIEFVLEGFEVEAKQDNSALEVDFYGTSVAQVWRPVCDTRYEYRIRGGGWKKGELQMTAHLGVGFELYVSDELEDVEGAVKDLEVDGALRSSEGGLATLANYCIRRSFFNALSKRLTALGYKDLIQTLQLNDKSVLQRHAWARPNNLAIFAQFAQPDEGFAIVEQNTLVMAGNSQPFSVQPVGRDVSWSVEPIPGYSSELGAIDEKGVYSAPTLKEGQTHRVQVVAIDSNKARATAMVTVVSSSIRMSNALGTMFLDPDQPDRAWSLKAVDGSGANLSWSVKSIVPAEAGIGTVQPTQPDAADFSYEPASGFAGIYAIAEVEVSNSQSKASCSSHLLIVHKERDVYIFPHPELSSVGHLKLRAIDVYMGDEIKVEWKVALGEGEIDKESGEYKPGESQVPGYALIFACNEQGEPISHYILPLPLTTFAALRKEQASNVTLERRIQKRKGAPRINA